jgi:hypothetical protein
MAADTLSLYGVNTKSNHTIYHYYKKIFLVPAGNLFFMSATSKDMIYEIQKIKHLWCRLSWTDTKNRIFSVDCYISRHQKLIFNNKKTHKPRFRPTRPRSDPAIIGLPLDDHGGGGAVSMLLHGTGRWRCTGGPGAHRQSLHASTPVCLHAHASAVSLHTCTATASLHARAPLPTQGGRICCDTIRWLAFA